MVQWALRSSDRDKGRPRWRTGWYNERYGAVIETNVDLGGGRGGTMSVTEQ